MLKLLEEPTMNGIVRKLSFGVCLLQLSSLFADLAFVTDWDHTVYAFDTDHLNTAATAYTMPTYPDNIAFSPDETTVYFTTDTGVSDVYSFPANDPSRVRALGTAILDPIGIAISSDGTLGFVAQDFNEGDTPGTLYSFPTAGATHTASPLTPSGTTIVNPLFIVISGGHAFVGDYENGRVYSVTFTETTYNAALIQNVNVGGLAISSDGYLYISVEYDEAIYRVPLTDLMGTLQLVASTSFAVDGIALSNDGRTLFATSVADGTKGVFSISIDGNSFGLPTLLTNLNISQAIDIAIQPTNSIGNRAFERPSNRRR